MNFLHYLDSAKLIQLWETWRVCVRSDLIAEVWDFHGAAVVEVLLSGPFCMTTEQQVTTATGYLLQRVSGVVERFS